MTTKWLLTTALVMSTLSFSLAVAAQGEPNPDVVNNMDALTQGSQDLTPQQRAVLESSGVKLPPLPAGKEQDMIAQGIKNLTPEQRAMLQNAGVTLPPSPDAGASGAPSGYATATQVAAATAAPAPSAAPNTFGTVFDPAFQNMTKKQFPMTPEQIRALRQIFQATQRASVAPIEAPTPTVSTQMVSLSPGSQPPIVKLATGFVTSVVFLDETGQPWPIADYSIGKPTAFTIQWDTNTNVLMIQGTGPYESGNMALRLAGLPTPVMLTLVSDQQKVDYRVDLRVQGRGPNAKAAMIKDAIPHTADTRLMDLLDGVPPLGSTRLTIPGGNAEAWLTANRLFLRTRLTLLSPEWTSTMSSADGTKVYELNPTPLILASKDGQTVTLKVEGL